jgi:hypothetical protein
VIGSGFGGGVAALRPLKNLTPGHVVRPRSSQRFAEPPPRTGHSRATRAFIASICPALTAAKFKKSLWPVAG